MYIDTITTEFTGYYDSVDEVYAYPSARQNLLLLNIIGANATTTTSTTNTEDEEVPEEDDTPTPPSAYLSAMDGDFSTDGATFTHSAGESEDITIGNAISQVMSGTLLNPDGLLDGLAFSKNVKAFIGVETTTEAATIPEGASAYVEFAPLGGTVHSHYAIGSVAYADGDVIRDMGEEITSISALPYLAGHIYFWTSSGACLYFDETEGYVPPAGSTYTYAADPRWHYVADISTTGFGDFMQGKYANTQQSLLMDGTRKYYVAGSKPTIYTWDVENGTKTTWQYVPMGIFDMSSISVSGVSYPFEAYDRMTRLDADATAWLESFLPTFESGTVEDFIMALETAAGLPSAYWGSYDTPNYDVYADFIASALYRFYTPLTYRQIVQWVAAFCGTNARINRYGYLEFFQYKASPNLPTITSDVIVSQSREVSRYTIPPITKLVWYDTIGEPIVSGTAGSTYTLAGNPLANYVTDAQTAVDNILTDSLVDIPVYNATSFTDACADPRVDIGDILTVTRTDGTTYFAPVMQYTLTWRGNCVAEYTATGNQTREAVTGTTQDAALAQKLADEKVDKAGDTMTGDLENTSVSSRRTVMQGNRFYAENTGDTTQNAALYYNGVAATNGTNTATLTPTGLNLDGTVLTSGIGTRSRTNGTTNIASGGYHALTEIALPSAGTWLLMISARFAQDATGRRHIIMSNTADNSISIVPEWLSSSAAINGATTMLHMTGLRVISGTATYYLNALQNSGKALDVTWVVDYVRIL